MARVPEAKLFFETADGEPLAELRITTLPGQDDKTDPAPLLDCRGDQDNEPSLVPVQLLESAEYRFEWTTAQHGLLLKAEPTELFYPDSDSGVAGRLRPGLFTGTIPVQLFIDDRLVGTQQLEVRSRKLDYLSQYRWMLRDVASGMSELVMDRFAAATASFAVDESRDAATRYQQFAFLRSLLLTEELEVALNEIVRRPHVAWVDRHETVTSAQGLRGDPYITRQLASRGDRVRWPDGPIPTVPRELDRRRTDATHDTTANRFVRFALERWRQVVSDIGAAIDSEADFPALERGRREVDHLLGFLNQVLAHDVFREAGILRRFPSDNQVLQRREGYRDVFRAYLEFELAARLSWPGGETVYAAGQKNVATLYEYWAFIELARVIAAVVGKSFDLSPLIELGHDGLNVTLREGQELVLFGTVTRNDRKLALALWFNRGYSNLEDKRETWTMPMRPDYSLRIGPTPEESAVFEPIILHFDAKYRVDFVRQVFGDPSSNDEERADLINPREGTTKRADLLKMHAYRDAIRRSAGAYVLYPGTDGKRHFREYHELLPGLGAFPLRPTETGDAIGSESLRAFVEQVLDHVATQISQHERGRYWIRESYPAYGSPPVIVPVASFLDTPPADTKVLLGYVRTPRQWAWIKERRLYNLRGKGRRGAAEGKTDILGCRLLVLSCPRLGTTAVARLVGDFEAYTTEEMRLINYPEPKGSYLCAPIEFISDPRWDGAWQSYELEELRRSKTILEGGPVTVSWLELAYLAGSSS